MMKKGRALSSSLVFQWLLFGVPPSWACTLKQGRAIGPTLEKVYGSQVVRSRCFDMLLTTRESSKT
jgi:hypothetical protein